MEASRRSHTRAIAALERWRVVPGDVFRAGPHLLACGDGRDGDFVAALMNEFPDRKGTILCMDPPYCAGGHQEADRIQGTWGEVANDNLSAAGYAELIAGALRSVRPSSAYVFTDWRMIPHLQRTMEACGLPWRSMIVWDKITPGLGAMWRAQHEVILFSTRRSTKRQPGRAAVGNVIQCKRSGNLHHATEKPVALLETLLRQEMVAVDASELDLVVDVMAGSGSTAVAACRVGLRALAVDLTPAWVAAALDRLKAEGHEPERITLRRELAAFPCPRCGATQHVSPSANRDEHLTQACFECESPLALSLAWEPKVLKVVSG